MGLNKTVKVRKQQFYQQQQKTVEKNSLKKQFKLFEVGC